MKLTLQEKLKAAKDHVDNKLTLSEVVQKYKLDPARLKYYVKLYKAYGEKPFLNSEHLYIDYYNNERLVWKIQKPPTKYRESFYLNV